VKVRRRPHLALARSISKSQNRRRDPRFIYKFDLNIVKKPDGTVQLEGGEAKTFPTIAIYSYTKDQDGNITTTKIRELPEQSPDDLEKPKQPIPQATPQP